MYSSLKGLLDAKYEQYNRPAFIEKDPVSIPHRFSKKDDIEIAGFLAATISWGNRGAILKSGDRIMELMHSSPHEFIMHHGATETRRLKAFVHRTFSGQDLADFCLCLQHVYRNFGGLESAFGGRADLELKERIILFRKNFLAGRHHQRMEKHVSDPSKKSAAKRICMFLRWMVRNDTRGVDFGLWKTISPAQLCLPLDVHTGNVSRELGLLRRKQNDWLAVEEVTAALRKLDPKDPVKYDFALFGMGVNKDLGV